MASSLIRSDTCRRRPPSMHCSTGAVSMPSSCPCMCQAEHFAAAIAGMRHIRSFAGYTLTMPHKAMAVHQCDELLANARACGAVNAVRIDPDGRLIGEIYDGVEWSRPLRPIVPSTPPPGCCSATVGAGGAGRAIAVAIALAGVGSLAIANRTREKAADLAETVRRAVPACAVEAGAAVDPAADE